MNYPEIIERKMLANVPPTHTTADMATREASLNGIRESYFAASVGRQPLPPRAAYPPVTPRKDGRNSRLEVTGDAVTNITNRNIQLKSLAIEEVESLISTAEGLITLIKGKSERFPPTLRKGEETVKDIDRELQWILPKGYTDDDVQKGGNITLSMKEIQEKLCRTRHAPNPSIQGLLNDLSGPTKVSRVILRDHHETMRKVDPHRDTTLPIGSTLELPTVSDVTTGLNEFLHSDIESHVKDELLKTHSDVDRLKRQISLQKADLKQCLNENRLVDAEETHRKLLDMYVQLLEILCSRYAELSMGSEDEGTFKKQLTELQSDADKVYKDFRNDKESLMAIVVKDIAKCKELKDKQDEKDKAALAAYEGMERGYYSKLKENERQHLKVLEEMRQKAMEIYELSEKRKEMVTDHVKSREMLIRDRFYIDEYKNKCDLYQKALERLKEYAQEELGTATLLDNYNRDMKNMFNNRNFATDCEDERKDELMDIYKWYKEYVFSSGDLVLKKQHRFDTLERQSRLAEFNISTVKDSLDPEKEKYEMDLHRLAAALQDTDAMIMMLNGQQDVTEQLVRSPMEALSTEYAERGEVFTHPTVEYVDHAVEEKRNFVNRTLKFVEDEEVVIEKKKDSIGRMRAQTEMESKHHSEISAQKKRLAITN
eukprot:Tbor_TRINITY_DN5642_c1_g1::TRINITY_DN5642_c1_g1_i1::g.9583::m.9583